MSTSVLPLARAFWLFQLAGASVGVTAALVLLGAAATGLASPLYLLLAVAGLVLFGMVFVATVRVLATDGLTLHRDGFGYGGRQYRWSQIAEFTPVGFVAKSHVRIAFRPDADLDGTVRLAQTCGRFGFYHPAAHLPVKGFATDGRPLAAVLNERLNSR
ncbi:MAG: hypothetical protein SW019_10265 [Actinomycetota bacterium]|nr:hypothetical protein [Actinomycetota bacterium]